MRYISTGLKVKILDSNCFCWVHLLGFKICQIKLEKTKYISCWYLGFRVNGKIETLIFSIIIQAHLYFTFLTFLFIYSFITHVQSTMPYLFFISLVFYYIYISVNCLLIVVSAIIILHNIGHLYWFNKYFIFGRVPKYRTLKLQLVSTRLRCAPLILIKCKYEHL